MSAILKNTTNERIGPSYFIKFKDGVVLPAILKCGAKQPILSLVINDEREVIQPWVGKILYDVETGIISGNDGQVMISFLEDISYDREVTVRYVLKKGDLTIPLDIDYLHYSTGNDFKASSQIDYFRVRGENKQRLEIDTKLASIIATLINALDLSNCRTYRRKNPNSGEIFIESLRDVIIETSKS